MATYDHIRNPVEWVADQLVELTHILGRAGRALRSVGAARSAARPAVNTITLADLRDVLARGYEDLGACRTDAMFIAAIYPLAGLLLGGVVLNYGLLPLAFPLASGFALIGPVAALGLYELSRRRELERVEAPRDLPIPDRGPAIGSIAVLGLVVLAIFALWLAAAFAIYQATLGPQAPTSIRSFVLDVFTTGAGWAMIVVGIGVGFLFAALVLTIGVVSFPLMLDRNVGPLTAAETSVRAVIANPIPMAAWGGIVAAGLVVGSLPLLLGLIIVMPVLGHATWHLYRRVAPR